MHITHYYRQGCRPLKNIFGCEEDEMRDIVNALSNEPSRAYNRFRNWEWYYDQRSKLEEWLYREFVRLGGRPKLRHPLYFVLGSNEYLESCYGDGWLKISLDIDDIDENEISFTLTDSLAMFTSNEPNKLLTKALFTKHMGDFKTYLPDQEREYIEVQVWRNVEINSFN